MNDLGLASAFFRIGQSAHLGTGFSMAALSFFDPYAFSISKTSPDFILPSDGFDPGQVDSIF